MTHMEAHNNNQGLMEYSACDDIFEKVKQNDWILITKITMQNTKHVVRS